MVHGAWRMRAFCVLGRGCAWTALEGLALETDRETCEAASIQRIWLGSFSVGAWCFLGLGCGSCFVAVALQAHPHMQLQVLLSWVCPPALFPLSCACLTYFFPFPVWPRALGKLCYPRL